MNTEVINRYADVIAGINKGICEFNEFLSPALAFPLIDVNNPSTYSDSLDKEWGFQCWPSKDCPGVYFFCCRNETGSEPSKLALYIGKASMREMGHRMYSHLKPYRTSGIYRRTFQGAHYVIEAMLASPVPNSKSACLASALEEFLIARGIGGVQLMNWVGVR